MVSAENALYSVSGIFPPMIKESLYYLISVGVSWYGKRTIEKTIEELLSHGKGEFNTKSMIYLYSHYYRIPLFLFYLAAYLSAKNKTEKEAIFYGSLTGISIQEIQYQYESVKKANFIQIYSLDNKEKAL